MCASPALCTVPRRAAGTTPPLTHDATRVPPSKSVNFMPRQVDIVASVIPLRVALLDIENSE
jgi:hypothetical protein